MSELADIDRFLLEWFNCAPETRIEDTPVFELRAPFVLTYIFRGRRLALDYLHREYARLR